MSWPYAILFFTHNWILMFLCMHYFYNVIYSFTIILRINILDFIHIISKRKHFSISLKLGGKIGQDKRYQPWFPHKKVSSEALCNLFWCGSRPHRVSIYVIAHVIPLMPVWVLVLVDCFYIYSNISTGDSRGITTTFHLTGVLINLQPSTSLIMKLIWFPCTCSWLLKFQEIFHISAALILFSPEILTIIGLFTFLLIKRWGAILNHGNNRRYSYLIFIWYFTLLFSCINT